MKQFIRCATLITFCLTILSCSSDGSDDDEAIRMRLVNVSPGAPALALQMERDRIFEDVRYKESSNYQTIFTAIDLDDVRDAVQDRIDELEEAADEAREEQLDEFFDFLRELDEIIGDNNDDDDDNRVFRSLIRNVINIYRLQDSDTFTVFAQEPFRLFENQDYTLLALNFPDRMEVQTLIDFNDLPDADFVKTRLINASPSPNAPVDIYIEKRGTDIAFKQPAFADAEFKNVSSYVQGEPGQFVMTVTRRDTKEVMFESNGFSLQAGKVYTLILVDRAILSNAMDVVVLLDNG